MALDIGEKRIGIALSDATGTLASPLVVLDAVKAHRDQQELQRLVDEYDIELIVVGLPLSLDGTEGPQARHVRAVAERLTGSLPVGVDYFDERHSSTEAKRVLSSAGRSSRQQRGSVDSVAAAVFLQGYLDSRGTK